MNNKKVAYRRVGGQVSVVEYDADAPCRICGLPVMEASFGGTDVCPACDCGAHRCGCRWTVAETMDNRLLKAHRCQAAAITGRRYGSE